MHVRAAFLILSLVAVAFARDAQDRSGAVVAVTVDAAGALVGALLDLAELVVRRSDVARGNRNREAEQPHCRKTLHVVPPGIAPSPRHKATGR